MFGCCGSIRLLGWWLRIWPLVFLVSHVYIFCALVDTVPEHLMLAGHFPLVLEVADSRVAVVRVPRARIRMMDLKDGILLTLLCV